MTKEDKQVQAKLERLKKAMYRNEQQMRETLMEYEVLLAQRESVISSIDALREFRHRRDRNFSREDRHADIGTRRRIPAHQIRQ